MVLTHCLLSSLRTGAKTVTAFAFYRRTIQNLGENICLNIRDNLVDPTQIIIHILDYNGQVICVKDHLLGRIRN